MGHRTMQGREIDMEKLARANELMPAIGNMRVNARGDELGSNGEITRSREEVAAEYYEANVPLRAVATEPAAPVVATKTEPVATVDSKSKKNQIEE